MTMINRDMQHVYEEAAFVFTMSVKLNRKKVLFLFVVCLTIVSAIFLLTRNGDSRKIAATNSSANVSTSAKNNEERITFLSAFGWEVSEEPLEVKEVRIPAEFDQVYLEYNELQLQQGMDLQKYANKRVKSYTYEVLNHPSGESGVEAHLLVYKDKVIGGDISSTRLDGFMHGFEMGETQTNTMIYDQSKGVSGNGVNSQTNMNPGAEEDTGDVDEAAKQDFKAYVSQIMPDVPLVGENLESEPAPEAEPEE